MKSTPLLLALLLMPLPARALNLSVETSLYRVNLKGSYTRETGYGNWKGQKEGLIYRLTFGERFRIKKGTFFRLSVTSGTTKAPWINLLSGEGNRLFEGNFKTFTVKELYFHKEGFIFERLSLTAGKQLFQIGTFLRDYLWGGKFSYKTSGGWEFTWNQIAGYEGQYLLFGTKEEDDVDIFNFRVKRGKLSAGLYWLSDARGEEKAKIIRGLTLGYTGKVLSLTGTGQNGKLSGLVRVKVNEFTLEEGYSQKGFTSYGFKEGVSSIGTIYRPSFSDIRFLKGIFRFWEGELYLLHLERANGSYIGDELGVSFERNISGNFSLFGNLALGNGGSYALMGGVRWSPERVKVKGWKEELIVKNRFSIKGEYSDFPRRWYEAQTGYQDYVLARHLGFWHSTYKLELKGRSFSVKISTGKDTKVDYLVWGNSADNFKYQKSHGKEWHLEEAYLKEGSWKLGLMELRLRGFIDESLAGLSYRTGRFELYALGQSDRAGGETKEPAELGVIRWKGERSEFYLLYRNGENSRTTVGFSHSQGNILAGGALQEGSWSSFVELKGRLKGWELLGRWRVGSKNFRTSGLKEYFWNEGYIFRPGEGNVRLLKFKATREIRSGLKKLDRLRPELSLIYLKVSRFSGSYVGEEGGLKISVKPGSRCLLSLIGTIGNNNSYYEGLAFTVSW